MQVPTQSLIDNTVTAPAAHMPSMPNQATALTMPPLPAQLNAITTQLAAKQVRFQISAAYLATLPSGSQSFAMQIPPRRAAPGPIPPNRNVALQPVAPAHMAMQPTAQQRTLPRPQIAQQQQAQFNSRDRVCIRKWGNSRCRLLFNKLCNNQLLNLE